ncbi:MAG: hypothetical protein WC370_00330 [Dehalococcoidales bacterium]|jgi:hypothetical protein
MTGIIQDMDFTGIAKSVKPDAKKRVVLPKALVREDVTYHIYANSAGQIVLDPQVTIPASELWLFQDKEALAAIDRGMAESKSGQTTGRGTFGKYVKNAP